MGFEPRYEKRVRKLAKLMLRGNQKSKFLTQLKAVAKTSVTEEGT